MSLFLPVRRATLLIPSGTASEPNKKHLFILLTDPVSILETGEKQILMVSMSTLKPQFPHDPTCFLYPSDHPFIKHKSYISYGQARIEVAQKFIKDVNNGIFIPQGAIDSGIFARICDGLTQSRFTAPKVLAFYEAATKQSP